MNSSKAHLLLGTSIYSSKEEIKKAYRVLAMKYHPDRDTGNETKFKEINAAFEYLENNGNDKFKDNDSMFRRTKWSKDDFDWYMDKNANRETLFHNIYITPEEAFSGVENKQIFIRHKDIPHTFTFNIPAGIQNEDEIESVEIPTFNIKFSVVVKNDKMTINWSAYADKYGEIEQDVFVSPIRMILGGNIEIPVLGGKKISVRIKPGMKANSVLKVQGRGYWRDMGRNLDRADLFIKIIPDMKKIDDFNVEELKEFVKAAALNA